MQAPVPPMEEPDSFEVLTSKRMRRAARVPNSERLFSLSKSRGLPALHEGRKLQYNHPPRDKRDKICRAASMVRCGVAQRKLLAAAAAAVAVPRSWALREDWTKVPAGHLTPRNILVLLLLLLRLLLLLPLPATKKKTRPSTREDQQQKKKNSRVQVLADVGRLERLAVEADELSRVPLRPRREHDVVHRLPLLRETQVEPVGVDQKLGQVKELRGKLAYVLVQIGVEGRERGDAGGG